MIELSIRIRDIDDAGQRLELPLSRAFLGEALDGMEADLSRSHVDARMELSKVGENVFVRGALDGELVLPCARCLAQSSVAVDVPLRLTATREEMIADDVEDDVDYFTHDGMMLELEGVLREALILAVPMSFVCRSDCKGLCPVCGGDRNERECGCRVESIDPRLSVLKGLKV